MAARAAKNALDLMIDTARAEPMPVDKRGRGVLMDILVKEFDRLARQKDASEWAIVQRKGMPETYK